MLPNYKKVLIVTDFSEVANHAIPFGYGLVQGDGKVVLAHIIEHEDKPNPMYSHYNPDDLNLPEDRDKMLHHLEAQLQQLVPLEASDAMISTQVVASLKSTVAEGIIQLATEHKVDVIVMASHGRTGLKHLLLGSVAEKVMQHSGLPLFVIPVR